MPRTDPNCGYLNVNASGREAGRAAGVFAA